MTFWVTIFLELPKVLAKALIVILVLAAFLVMPLAVTANGEPGEGQICVNMWVQDPDSGIWMDEELYDVPHGQLLHFKSVITNCGPVPVRHIRVLEYLDGLGYADTAMLQPMGISLNPPDYFWTCPYYMWCTGDRVQWLIDEWTDPDLVLAPGEEIEIDFYATFEDYYSCYLYTDAMALDPWGVECDDWDDVYIYPECVDDPSVDVNKTVWDPINEEWVKDLEAYVCQTLTFKIEVHNDGGVPLAGVFVEDILSESLDYIDGSADPEPWWVWTEDEGDTGLYWDFYELDLDPCETITITFDAHVNMEGEDTNEVCVYGYMCDYWYWYDGMALSKTMRDRAGSDRDWWYSVDDCDIVYIYGRPSAPDLTVEKEVTVEGSTFTVEYVVRNIGTGAAGESTTCMYHYMELGPEAKPNGNTQSCPALDPGESYEGTFETEDCPPCGEPFIVEVCADNYNDVVDEINEENNCMTNEIVCPCKPDLVVEKELEFSEEGNYFIVHYGVTNIGGSPAEASTTCKYVDGVLQETQTCPALEPDESHGGAFDVEECPCGRTIAVKVCADNDNVVDESEELNNCEVNYLECPPCPDADLCPVKYRWSVYHDYPGWEWDDPIFSAWQDVRFMNLGPGDAFDVEATVTYAPANVVVTDPYVWLGDIGEGGSAWSSDSYAFTVDTSDPQDPDDTIRWDVAYQDAGGAPHVLHDVPQWCPGAARAMPAPN